MGKLGAAVAREIRAFLPAMIFFLIVFHLITLTRAAIIDDFSVTALRATTATIGALIVAKSILVVEKLPLARLFSQRLILSALWKALLFGMVAILFRFIEELVPLISKHKSLAAATTTLFEEIHWPEFGVFQLWLFGALFLYCLTWELLRAAGPDKARAVLWGPRAPHDGHGEPARPAPTTTRP